MELSYALLCFLLLFCLASNAVYSQQQQPSSSILSSQHRCDAFSAALVVRCVTPLLEYTRGSSSLTAPIPDPNIICSLYADYKLCAPDYIRSGCEYFVNSVESVYDYLCSDAMKENFTRTYKCISKTERLSTIQHCESNSTLQMRDAVLSGNSTDPLITSIHCGAIKDYFKCARRRFIANCGDDGWQVKMEVTIRATNAKLANCSFEDDPSEPLCNDDGFCFCRDGYYMRSNKTCADVDECIEFGICSQKCQNTPGSFVCSCDSRYYSLDPHSKRACIRNEVYLQKHDEPVSVFFAHGQTIWNISLDGENFQLIRAGLEKVAMIDIDVKGQRLYYADIGANKIERLRYFGAFPSVLQDVEVDGTEGVAVDWIGDNLYSLRHTNIYVQKLIGDFRTVLYKNVFKLPRALAVHPRTGYLFATDWGQNPFVARAAMDGSKFEKIVNKGLVWPNGLTIDYYTDKLYWADAYVDIIECSNFDGSNRRTIVEGTASVPHVFALAVLDDWLYWTDWTYRGIVRGNKFTGANVSVIAQAALLPYGIKLSHPAVQPTDENPCLSANCSQLCLLSPRNASAAGDEQHPGYQCRCGDGFRVVDLSTTQCEVHCNVSKELVCGGQRPKCLSKRYWCDGTSQCDDKSDESKCPQRICAAGQFQCHNSNGCLSSSQLCDTTPDCADLSDEKYC